ncbi:MAG: thioesterase family protein [Gammaproteobacteria bacterium]|nr:thioesterase family protein [Gammaproteobacteria bacterium]
MSDPDYLGSDVVSGQVLPEWIDVNQHMNVAYYILAFDLAVDSLWERFGITSEYVNVTDSSTFAVESHITWQRELSVDQPYVITTQLLAYDEKRIHQFMRMYHSTEHYLAATAEWLNLHVDLSVRKVAPWPKDILHRIAAFAEQQGNHDWPPEAGKQMQVAKPLFSSRN